MVFLCIFANEKIGEIMNDSILNDLGHKTKKVSDLVRYISNTAPGRDGGHNNSYPNFSFLLGAGASVTSGVRSGGQLIQAWKKEISMEPGISDIDEYLKTCNWYDSANEYASLFENRYDLQRQRRIFVEKEVADKSPSIGYAYLVSLVNNGWFNTIFTTNFDDLINESFYRFSKRRPIVCAHDSSISAVTITSDRPKIIKLHGDYLFDNIKATLRETESLELNMQLKIREFAKNSGLIVVGYSGQDRSIMDILTVLISQPDYFKNGIYWCVMESDIEKIGAELKKFLWRDRVFLVKIDGFDELMAEMNESLNDGALPIKNELLSREHHDEIVKGLTTNPYIANSKSDILKNACKQLNDSVDKNLVEDYLHFIIHQREKNKQKVSRDDEPQFKTGLADSSDKEKMQIQEWATEVYVGGRRKKVLGELSAIDIFSLPDTQYKLELLSLYVEIATDLPEEKSKLFYDELIRLNPRNQMFYMAAATRMERISWKIEYLKKAVISFPNDYYVYNKYAESLIDYKRGLNFDDDVQVAYEEIENTIEKSISLGNRLSNSIWASKARWLMYRYKNDINERDIQCDNLIKELEDMHGTHPNMLEVLSICESKKLTEALFQQYISFYLKADNVDYMEKCYIMYIEWLQDNKKFEDIKKIMSEYEEKVVPSNSYLRCKVQCCERYMLYEEAINILETLRPTREDSLVKMRLLAKLQRKDDLERYFKTLISPSNSMKLVFYEESGCFDKIVEFFDEKIKNNKYLSMQDISLYSYSLLQLEKYQECYDFLSKYYAKPETCEAFVIVNYLMAKKNKPGKASVDSDVKKKIVERPYIQYGDDVMAAGYSLLQDKQNMMRYIKKELSKNPDFIYFCKTWPVLNKTLETKDYEELDNYIKTMNISSLA